MSRTEARILLAADHVSVAFNALNDDIKLPFEPRNVQTATAALAEGLNLVRQRHCRSIKLRLAGIWLRWQALPWGVSVAASDEEWQSVAAAQAYKMPGLLAQVPVEFMTLLVRQAQDLRLSIAAVPELACRHVMTHENAKDAVLAVLEDDSLTFLRLQAGVAAAVAAYPQKLAADEALAAVETAWHRLALRDASFANSPRKLFWNAAGGQPRGDAPSGFSRVSVSTDFLWRSTKPLLAWPLQHSPWRRWPGVVFAASLGIFLLAGIQFYTALQQQQEAMTAAQAARMDTATLAPVRAPAQQKERVLRISRVNDAVRQLNAPVDRLLKAARPLQNSGIALLGVQIRSSKERLLLVEGTAKTMQDMAAYVKLLSAEPVFASVWLARHETTADDNAEGYHFMIEAGWRE